MFLDFLIALKFMIEHLFKLTTATNDEMVKNIDGVYKTMKPFRYICLFRLCY